MILYHYSVDSYRGGENLINDFKKTFRFAEPFLLAIEKSEDCFWSVYFAAMACSRELCALGLRKHENYVKDAVEGIFEWVRRRTFPEQSVSRIGCVYYCESEEEALSCLWDDCIENGDFTYEQIKLLEVEVEDGRVFRYDQVFYNQAMEVLELTRDLASVVALAESYYSMRRSAEPVIEILSDGENRVLRELPLQQNRSAAGTMKEETCHQGEQK